MGGRGGGLKKVWVSAVGEGWCGVDERLLTKRPSSATPCRVVQPCLILEYDSDVFRIGVLLSERLSPPSHSCRKKRRNSAKAGTTAH